jgi:hypothetical protein
VAEGMFVVVELEVVNEIAARQIIKITNENV